MDDLVFILQRIKNVSEHPEREYALIFKDETRYFSMIAACHHAYDESYKSHLKLFNPEHIPIIQDICLEAGIKMPSAQQLSQPHIRDKLLAELKKTKTKDGESFFYLAWSRNLMRTDLKRDREKNMQLCKLVAALHTISYDPASLGLTVGDLYTEAMAGKVCIGWEKCKKIIDAIQSALRG